MGEIVKVRMVSGGNKQRATKAKEDVTYNISTLYAVIPTAKMYSQ